VAAAGERRILVKRIRIGPGSGREQFCDQLLVAVRAPVGRGVPAHGKLLSVGTPQAMRAAVVFSDVGDLHSDGHIVLGGVHGSSVGLDASAVRPQRGWFCPVGVSWGGTS
jgi:hypothetical protein